MPEKSKLSRRDVLRLPATAAVLGAASSLGFGQNAQLAPLRDIPYPDSPDLEVPAFERLTLEMSPKPFRSLAEADIRAVCVELFRQWSSLIRRVDAVAIMLWTADGSEILDYRGRMADEIEWARYIGIGTRPEHAPADDPGRIGLHSTPHLYMENPPKLTYGSLATIVRTLKQVGREITGKPITVGATFDPGPEFANSQFKYVRHPEIADDRSVGNFKFVSCVARLHADKVAYAGFPSGIPEDTSIGTFLGGQSQRFLTDLGFDYLWLSNGFGFSVAPWAVRGPLFDGEHFDVARAPKLRDAILGFWKDFRKQCPRFPLETRGTNLLLGSDLATSACPLQDIYDGGFGMIAPPNSPWAAIDGDFGLELVGYLSRIAELPPDGKFPFRFYIHDPWWLNSPWLDRYGREPHDIYLPLATARVDTSGAITRPSFLEFLTADNSYGRMPEQVPNEVTPHILSAMDSFSDAPGLLTWICPFREYYAMIFGQDPQPATAFFADWFLRGAVNSGFPLNSVASTGNYLASEKKNPHLFDETVLVSLLPPGGSALEASLLARVHRGLPTFFYGPVTHASSTMLHLLGLATAAPIEGELQLQSSLPLDAVLHGDTPKSLQHRSVLCAGGVDTVSTAGASTACATVRSGKEERVYAVAAGSAVWLRGSFSSTIPAAGGARIPTPDDPTKLITAESLARILLSKLGVDISVSKATAATRLPVLFVSRCRGGYFFSGYSPSTLSTIHLRLPIGAPLLLGRECWIESDRATYTFPRAWHHEARVFVSQQEASEVSCVEYYAGMVGFRRRMLVKGLRNATVTFLPEDDQRVVMQVNDMRLHITESNTKITRNAGGKQLQASGITGSLFISW